MTQEEVESVTQRYHEALRRVKAENGRVSALRTSQKLDMQSLMAEILELKKSLEDQARKEIISTMAVDDATITAALTASNQLEPAKSYVAGCEAHSAGLSPAALLMWTNCCAYWHGESMFQIGCYFLRRVCVLHNEIVARSCFRSALNFGCEDLSIEIFVRALIQDIEAANLIGPVDSSALDSYVASNVADAVLKGRTINISDRSIGSVDAAKFLDFKCYLFPQFPEPIQSGTNIVGLWEVALKGHVGRQEREYLLRYRSGINSSVNAAKALRGELGIDQRNIFSDESARRQYAMDVAERLVRFGHISGFIRRK